MDHFRGQVKENVLNRDGEFAVEWRLERGHTVYTGVETGFHKIEGALEWIDHQKMLVDGVVADFEFRIANSKFAITSDSENRQHEFFVDGFVKTFATKEFVEFVDRLIDYREQVIDG